MATRRRLIMSLIMCSVMLMMVAVSVIGALSAVNSSHNLDGTITYASYGNINFEIEDGVNATITNATLDGAAFDEKMCSYLYTGSISGDGACYRYVKYDNCNPFGMIAGDFGEIENLSKHSDNTLSTEMAERFNRLDGYYNNIMSAFEIPTDGTEYKQQLLTGTSAYTAYNSFHNLGKSIYDNSLLSFTHDVGGDMLYSAIIGINYPYVIAPKDTYLSETYDCQALVANLFGFEDKAEFMGYAQELATIYAEHRVNPINEALDNGCYDTGNSFIFPIAVSTTFKYGEYYGDKQGTYSDPSTILTYMIVDSNGFVSVWVNDVGDLYSSLPGEIYYIEEQISVLHCYNQLFLEGKDKLKDITIEYDGTNQTATNLSAWKNVKLEFGTNDDYIELKFDITNLGYYYSPSSYVGVEIVSFEGKFDNVKKDATINVVGGANSFIVESSKQIIVTFEKEDTSQPASITSFNLNIKLTNIEPNLPDDWLYVNEEYAYYGTVVKGTSALPKNLIIPSGVLYYPPNGASDYEVPVAVIYANAFAGQNIESVYIPESIEGIGNYAFDGCKNLKEVYIPASVTSIGVAPFCSCSALESIKVDYDNSNYTCVEQDEYIDPDSTYYASDFSSCNAILDTYDNNALIQGCQNTCSTSSYIAKKAFYGHTGVTGTVKAGYDSNIGDFAYAYTSITAVNVSWDGSGSPMFGINPFAYCSKLKNINVEDNVPTYDDGDGCSSGLGYEDSDGAINSPYYGGHDLLITTDGTIIAGCKNSVMPIVKNTTFRFTIDNYAFAGSGISSISLTYVTHIGSYAFNASSLTTVTTSGTWYYTSSATNWKDSTGGTVCNMQANILKSSPNYYYKK